MLRYGADCWLVNTGWVGGPYGVGKRISIRYTRALLNAALTGKLHGRRVHDRPGLRVPGAEDLPGRAGSACSTRPSSWPNRDLYCQRYRQLAARFIDNFKKFDTAESREVEKAGPKL